MSRSLLSCRSRLPSSFGDVSSDFESLVDHFFGPVEDRWRQLSDGFTPNLDIAESETEYEKVTGKYE